MKIRTQDYNEVTVIELQGELVSDFTVMFQNSVMSVVDRGRVGIVIDMSNVGFVDSEGLEQMLWSRDYCNENDCQLRLAGLDENCEKILEVTRLKNEFDRHTDLSEAVKSFA